MSLIVEDWSGVEDANGYITVAYFKAYHDARGNDYSAFTDPDDIEVAIVKATDYMEILYADLWKGAVSTDATTLQLPRSFLYDRKGTLVEDWPSDIQKACAEYAVRALSAELMPDPVALSDSNNLVRKTTEKVGPIEESIEYSVGSQRNVRSYPEADRLLKFWLRGQGGVYR